ncbi:hypothetical protein L195_g059687, partial [Trifolium pratense]
SLTQHLFAIARQSSLTNQNTLHVFANPRQCSLNERYLMLLATSRHGPLLRCLCSPVLATVC